jgi:hypothetical protein
MRLRMSTQNVAGELSFAVESETVENLVVCPTIQGCFGQNSLKPEAFCDRISGCRLSTLGYPLRNARLRSTI